MPDGIPDGITANDVLNATRDFDAGVEHRFLPPFVTILSTTNENIHQRQ